LDFLPGVFCVVKNPCFYSDLFYACGGPFPENMQEPCLQKFRFYPERVYDLSGYAGGEGSSPYALFDENA
jgi:hypothetical protein